MICTPIYSYIHVCLAIASRSQFFTSMPRLGDHPENGVGAGAAAGGEDEAEVPPLEEVDPWKLLDLMDIGCLDDCWGAGVNFSLMFWKVFGVILSSFLARSFGVKKAWSGFEPFFKKICNSQRTKNQQIRISIALCKRCPLKKNPWFSEPVISDMLSHWFIHTLVVWKWWVFRHSSASSSHCGPPFSATSRQRVHRRYPMIFHPTFIHVLLGKICSQTS